MRPEGLAKGGFFPTPPRVTDLVAELIQPPAGYARKDETLRVLDPCCGEGDALVRLAGALRKPHAADVETYGVELHAERAEAAKARLDHVLGTDLFATSIANGAFGLLYLNPPVRLRLGGGEARRARFPYPLQRATWRRTACSSSSCPGSGCRCRRGTSPPTSRASTAGPSPSPSARPTTRSS